MNLCICAQSEIQTGLRATDKSDSHANASFPMRRMKANITSHERSAEVVIARRITVTVGAEFLPRDTTHLDTIYSYQDKKPNILTSFSEYLPDIHNAMSDTSQAIQIYNQSRYLATVVFYMLVCNGYGYLYSQMC